MTTTFSFLQPDTAAQETWPRFFDAQIIQDGQVLAILVREFDGTISAVRLGIDQVAD